MAGSWKPCQLSFFSFFIYQQLNTFRYLLSLVFQVSVGVLSHGFGFAFFWIALAETLTDFGTFASFTGTWHFGVPILRIMRTWNVLVQFSPILEILYLICHVGQHLLLGDGVIGTYNGVGLFGEADSEILRQQVQISASHGLITSLTCWSICICAVYGSCLRWVLLRSHGFFFYFC